MSDTSVVRDYELKFSTKADNRIKNNFWAKVKKNSEKRHKYNEDLYLSLKLILVHAKKRINTFYAKSELYHP